MGEQGDGAQARLADPAAPPGGIGLWSWDVTTGQVNWTDTLFEIFGVDPAEFTPSYDDFLGLVDPDHRDRVAATIAESVAEQKLLHYECPIVLPTGEQRRIRATADVITDPSGRTALVHGTAQDITPPGEEEIGSTLHDPVTGLARHAVLRERGDAVLARARRKGTSTAMLVLDLDQFHEVNDEFGIRAGDELLAEVGRRLEQLFRDYDTVGRLEGAVTRLGGDQFLALCEEVDPVVPIRRLGERVCAALLEPVEVIGGRVTVTASVGIAVSRAGDVSLEELFLRADAARRTAKGEGRGSCAVFEEETRTHPGRADEEALGQALERGEFRLAYQPKISLATDRMTGTEALLRWEHPERGLVPPLDFIPLAEDTGLIVDIGAWVIEQACRELARWDRMAPQRMGLTVSVNVSARQFGPDLVAVVGAALDASGINPAALCLEVTESVVMTDVDAAVGILRALADLGVRLSIDDFGTGYSSLAYLKRFPIHEVKIDKSFVDGLGQDPDDTAIVAAVMAVSHALDLVVVAEGVETAEQLQELRKLGCEYVQGYYFSRPVAPQDIDSILNSEAPAGSAVVASGSGRPDRVLVVDDASDVRMLAQMSLSAAGFEVHQADDGHSGLAAAAQVVPDCILLDLVLPDMSGFEVCRSLRSDPATADCTILMLTGADDAADKVEAFASGVDDYIVKPFSPRDLTSRVHAALRRRRGADAVAPPASEPA